MVNPAPPCEFKTLLLNYSTILCEGVVVPQKNLLDPHIQNFQSAPIIFFKNALAVLLLALLARSCFRLFASLIVGPPTALLSLSVLTSKIGAKKGQQRASSFLVAPLQPHKVRTSSYII